MNKKSVKLVADSSKICVKFAINKMVMYPVKIQIERKSLFFFIILYKYTHNTEIIPIKTPSHNRDCSSRSCTYQFSGRNFVTQADKTVSELVPS